MTDKKEAVETRGDGEPCLTQWVPSHFRQNPIYIYTHVKRIYIYMLMQSRYYISVILNVLSQHVT